MRSDGSCPDAAAPAGGDAGDPARTARLGRWVGALAVLVALNATVALIGWASGRAVLASGAPGLVAMNPVTALTFLVAAGGLLLRTNDGGRPSRQRVGVACGVSVTALGVLVLLGYAIGTNLGIDQFFFRDKLASLTGSPNRMAPNTAVAFVLAGLALAGLDLESRHGRRPAQHGAVVVLLLGLLTMTGYAYGTWYLTRVQSFIPMALNTGLGFGLIALGVLLARPDRGLMRVVTRRDAVGVTARRLLGAAVCVPWMLGWLCVSGQGIGLYGPDLGAALLVVSTIAMLAAVTWWSTTWLAQASQEAARLQERVRVTNRLLSVLATSPDDDVFADVLDVVRDVFASPSGFFGYVDENGDLVCPPTTGEAEAQRIVLPRQGLGEIWDRALRERRSVYENAGHTVHDGQAPTERSLAAPILYQGTLVGALHVADRRHDYGEADRESMETLCAAIAPALNARLHRQRHEREQHRIETLLRGANTQLEASNRELESFSYSVSHDLRAPLRAMDGFTRILLEEYAQRLDDEGRRLLAIVCDNARHMGRLIDDLLALSRLGRRELERTTVDTAMLCRSVVEQLRQVDPERRVAVRIASLLPVHGDRGMLHQAFANLLGNAWKFTRHRTDAGIDIGCREGRGEIVYFVRDNGAGFDMRYASKLFGVFQRLHRPEQFEGTGVGLAIVRRVVERHGGRVWAEARIDEGATFYLALPSTSREVADGAP